MKNLGAAIKSLRKLAGISQGECAEMIWVSQTYLSLIERGVKQPSLYLIEQIGKVIGVPVYYIFFTALDVDSEVAEDRRATYMLAKPAISGLIEGILFSK